MGLFFRVMIVGVSCSLCFGQGGGEQTPTANVVVDAVRVERLVQRRVVTGEIRSRRVSEVASQVEGMLQTMEVEEGDVVVGGQLIARIDNERAVIGVEVALADVDFARAMVDERSAGLAVAQRDLGRIEELDRRGSSGVSQLDEARTLVSSRTAQMAQGRAELVSAIGELRRAERELADMTIEAPFSGRVLSKHGEVGQWVGRGDEIVTIVSLDALEARVDIPEEVYLSVLKTQKSGGQIEMSIAAISGLDDGVNGGGRVFGEISAILARADSLSRLFSVRIAVSVVDEQGEVLLRPGMSLSAWIPTGKPGEFLTVSKDAIVRKPGGELVFYSNDGIAVGVPITRLFAVGDRVAVRSSVLKDGMLVVVDGNERLEVGFKLLVQPAPSKDVVGDHQDSDLIVD